MIQPNLLIQKYNNRNHQIFKYYNKFAGVMDLRKLAINKSIFYRGISLKEYLTKSSKTHPNLEYKDDETILVDQNHVPVSIEDGFISTEMFKPAANSCLYENKSLNFEELAKPLSSSYLPSIQTGKQMKTKVKNWLTERNSTDTSLCSQFELRTSIFPSLERKQVVRQRNITMASRSSSNQISCRKKLAQVIKEAEQNQQEGPCVKQKSLDNKQYVQSMKKQMILKRCYQARGSIKDQHKKQRYFERVKSNAD